MSAGVCPRCGAAASGKFCAECGASLAPLTCPACGHVLPAGSRFCTKCGAPVAGQAAPLAAGDAVARADSQLPWWIAGGTLVLLIVLLAWPVIHPKEPEPAAPAAAAAPFAGGAGGAPGTGSPPDLSTMTPREAADRLYNRVMQSVSAGDEAAVQQFLPMAIQAYGMVTPLDDDARYHLATLQRAGADFAAALATARQGLATKPDHLLLLGAAADAAEGMGEMDAARTYWKHFLDVFDVQHAMGLEEYRDHEQVVQESRTHARELLGL